MSRGVASKTALIATLAVGTLGKPSGLPIAAVPVVAPPLVLTSIGRSAISAIKGISNSTHRFIRAPDHNEIWYENGGSKHLVRFQCGACGDPPPCENTEPVGAQYIAGLQTGEDFSCQMLNGVQINKGVREQAILTPNPNLRSPVTTTRPLGTTAASSNAQAADGGSSSGWLLWLLFGLLLCCCMGGISLAAYHFMTGKKKPSKKGKKRLGAEDRVPLVQDDAPRFGSSNKGASAQMTAMAPTYTAINPQMGQAALAAQAQMPTYTHMGQQQQPQHGQHANMPTQAAMMGQTNTMGQAAMPTQAWSPGMPSPSQRDTFDAAQASMQTMVLEQPPAMQQASMQTMVLEQPSGAQAQGCAGQSRQGSFAMQQASMQTMVLEQPPGAQAQAYAGQSGQGGSFALGTQAAFPPTHQQQLQQEMELVTVTPGGYAVTPLAAGTNVPSGVPVYNQMPRN